MIRARSLRWTAPVLATSLVLAACSAADADDDAGNVSGKADDPDATIEQGVAISSSSVQALGGDLSSVRPEIDAFVVGDPLPASTYVQPMSALGYYGPLGPYGPLGVLGPVGDGSWNPSSWIGLSAPWDSFATLLTDAGGPLSASGPLGPNGPLGDAYWDDLAARESSLTPAFLRQLEPGGLFVPLGPIGPLGALGATGPLGPVGAHGHEADDVGNWTGSKCHGKDPRNGGGICRVVSVDWKRGDTRVFELFEDYEESFAQAMPDNDTSFMVRGRIDGDEVDSYPMHAAQLQTVTVVAFGAWTKWPFTTAMLLLGESATLGFAIPPFVPGAVFPFNVYRHASSFDDVDLVLDIEVDGTVHTITADSADVVDWISVQVPAGALVTAHVNVASQWRAPWRVVDADYRLFVVGSPPWLTSTNVGGAHQFLVDYQQ